MVRCAPRSASSLKPPDRLGVEDGGQDVFWKILEKYNNPCYWPANCLGDLEPAVRKLNPNNAHTRDYDYLYMMWKEAKPIITKAKEGYGVSVQNDPDKSRYVRNNMGILYLWVRLEQARVDSLVLKTVPDGVGQEDGTDGPPSTTVKRPKRVNKVVNEKTPPATPQAASADLLTAAVTALVGTMAQDVPKASAMSAPPPRNGSIELALRVLGANADETTKALANQMLQVAMRKQAEDDGIIVIDD